MKKINWINSWKSNAKKNKWSLCFRLWKLTLLEVTLEEKKLRLIVLNLGFQV
jgi:hypothetical protein